MDGANQRKRVMAEIFSIMRVSRLRRAAVKARELPFEESDFWPEGYLAKWQQRIASTHAYDLLRVFDTLWLKPGFELRVSVYRSGGNGNGEIWAVPTDNQPVDSGEGSGSEEKRMDRSSEVVPLMQAIEGDGSPWSYVSASILSREAEEFGAMWHGCEWSDQKILSKPPRQRDNQDLVDTRERTGEAPAGTWTWCGAVPRRWEPAYADTGTSKVVTLHIFNPVGGYRIYQATDTYPAGSYDAETEDTVLCWGEGGIIY